MTDQPNPSHRASFFANLYIGFRQIVLGLLHVLFHTVAIQGYCRGLIARIRLN